MPRPNPERYWTVGQVPPIKRKRFCAVCQTPLSQYNKGFVCFHHPRNIKQHAEIERAFADKRRRKKISPEALEYAAEHIITIFSAHCGVSEDSIRNPRGNKDAAHATALTVYAIKKIFNVSYQKLAQRVFDLEASHLHKLYKGIKTKVERDEATQDVIVAIQNEIKQLKQEKPPAGEVL